jgi:transposase
MLKMDQAIVVRHKVLVEKRSVRSVAREHGLSRNTVKRYAAGAPIGVRKAPARERPVREKLAPRIEALLAASTTWTQGKQQLTASRLWRMLRDEGHVVGRTLVQEHVAEWKRRRREVFVPLVYRPGELAEVDFFEVWVDLDDQRRRAWMFVMRLMYSKRDFARLYEFQDQVSFLDGHVRAFCHFGGVPQRIAYDNLKLAVRKILVGGVRALTARFTALVGHYALEPSFARPATGHDKGGVEARGKAIRWQHLVPIPSAQRMSEMSTKLISRLDRQASEQRDRDGKTVLERFDEERSQLVTLPRSPFVAAATSIVSASRRALVQVGGATYSVPEGWAGLDVTAHLGPDEVELVGPDGSTRHPRQRFGGRSIDYRHYLRELSRKPQAVRQVIPELLRDLGEPFGGLWRALVEEHGPRQAARIFAAVLDALVERGREAVLALVAEARERNEPLLLALRASTSTRTLDATHVPDVLRAIEVPASSSADFDALFNGGEL